MKKRFVAAVALVGSFILNPALAQQKTYPKGYFRNPLNIKMELVANFGELRANHWHMGLDIRTQQRENLPVHAAAEGYISRIKIEPGGFGRAVYITHPNGFTTLYAHLNAFMPALESWVKEQQYQKQSWAVELTLPPQLFPVQKGQFFAYSGNTGGSAGPHVHFEIRDTKTENCLNPLLFDFPIADAVPPTLTRLALYDRNRSTYAQTPQLLALTKAGASYRLLQSNSLKVGTDKISFALGAVDKFSASTNPNGIYSARIFLDDQLQSAFILDNISYDKTRYFNAQTDYRYKFAGGPWVQHLSRLPGDESGVYTPTESNGVLDLADGAPHNVKIEVCDANQNLSVLNFSVQYDASLHRPQSAEGVTKFTPNYVNVFEQEDFEAFTTETTVYDTVYVQYKKTSLAGADVHHFVSASIPAHDGLTVRIKPNIDESLKDKVVIRSTAGTRKTVEKGVWNGDWVSAKFRQFGTFEALVDDKPPVVPAPPTNLSKSTRLVFTPTDNLGIKGFTAKLNGNWLRFTNNGGRTWIYTFDEKFPRGTHNLTVTVEDIAGNKTTKTWTVTR